MNEQEEGGQACDPDGGDEDVQLTAGDELGQIYGSDEPTKPCDGDECGQFCYDDEGDYGDQFYHGDGGVRGG